MRYVAFLRGIAPMNPAMKNERLREVFERLGFQNVSSVISSGNIIFESDRTDIVAMEAMLEHAWPERLGFTSMTIIKSQADITQLIDLDPFHDTTHSPKTNLNVTFLKKPRTDRPQFPVRPDNRTYELIGLHKNAVFSIVDLTGSKTPDLMVYLEKQFGKDITTRTWKTIQRIHAKLTAHP